MDTPITSIFEMVRKELFYHRDLDVRRFEQPRFGGRVSAAYGARNCKAREGAACASQPLTVPEEMPYNSL